MAAVCKTLTHQYLENKVGVFCVLLPIKFGELCFGYSIATTSLECELILQLQGFDVLNCFSPEILSRSIVLNAIMTQPS